jgi:anti-sigma regulatory factor (Ser/Thr protein kinase)
MEVSSPTAKLAAAVLEGCTNVLHAAYTNRNPGDDNGLQFLLDDVRYCALYHPLFSFT